MSIFHCIPYQDSNPVSGNPSVLLLLYKEEHMDKLPGAPFWLPMHPVCAQYKTLISHTVNHISKYVHLQNRPTT